MLRVIGLERDYFAQLCPRRTADRNPRNQLALVAGFYCEIRHRRDGVILFHSDREASATCLKVATNQGFSATIADLERGGHACAGFLVPQIQGRGCMKPRVPGDPVLRALKRGKPKGGRGYQEKEQFGL